MGFFQISVDRDRCREMCCFLPHYMLYLSSAWIGNGVLQKQNEKLSFFCCMLPRSVIAADNWVGLVGRKEAGMWVMCWKTWHPGKKPVDIPPEAVAVKRVAGLVCSPVISPGSAQILTNSLSAFRTTITQILTLWTAGFQRTAHFVCSFSFYRSATRPQLHAWASSHWVVGWSVFFFIQTAPIFLSVGHDH